MKLKFLLIYLVLGGLVFALPVQAISPSAISVNVVPPNPTPGENVNIALSSFAANLDSVNIAWLVNGKNVLSGIGKKSFSVTAGVSGSNTQIVAKIYLPDGQIDKNITIRPSVMVLLWQAPDSYVPPFYKGKALFTAEGDVKIVAMPEIRNGGVMVNPKNMTYAWKKNYSNMAGESGYGKSSFTFSTDYLDSSNNVSVVASTIDQNYSSESNINVTTTSPKISFYKKDAELGTIWERALPTTYKIQGDEIIQAIPYFISPKDFRRPDVVFSWFINDLMVNMPSFQKNLIPLRVEAGTTGTSKLKVEIENTASLSGTASREISIEF